MSTKGIKDLQASVKKLEAASNKLGKEGISRQESQANQLTEIKVAIIEAHEKEKKELKENIHMHELWIGTLDTLIKKKDAEIAELKKNIK